MDETRPPQPKGTGPFYVVAVAGSLLSLDTAARFFSGHMHIDGLSINGVSAELVAVCGVGELTLLACGYAMKHAVRRHGKPGPAQLVAVVMCTAAAAMAVALNGPIAGGMRAFFGPVLALIALHLALGIEIKVKVGQRTSTLARVARELRERMLSRLGLADDARDALARTRDRAAERAARLATDPGRVMFRRSRLARAVRASGVAVDEAAKARMLAHRAAYGNLDALMDMDTPSPWTSPEPVLVPVPRVPVQRRPSVSPVSGGPAIGWDVAKVVRLIQEGYASVDIQAACDVSAKVVQRATRVVRAIAEDRVADAVRGDITVKFVQQIRTAMEVAK